MAGKVILVTGGNRGIGYGIVQSLLKRSSAHNIIVASRERAAAEKAIVELHEDGVKSSLYPLALDITKDDTIQSAVAEVRDKFGKLDVLINNAGIAKMEGDISDLRSAWAHVLDTNVISVRIVSELFMPVLQKSDDPRVVNVSSVRGSFERVTSGRNPPTGSIPYSVSKAALNLMTVEMAAKHTDVTFQAVCPGHCKTGLNGFRGARDPVVGGTGAAELALAEKGEYKAGFWEFDEKKGMQEVGW